MNDLFDYLSVMLFDLSRTGEKFFAPTLFHIRQEPNILRIATFSVMIITFISRQLVINRLRKKSFIILESGNYYYL